MSWIQNLRTRVSFVRRWREQGFDPPCCMIDLLWSPQGFLVSVAQMTARSQDSSMEEVSFQHRVMTALEDASDVRTPPETGVFLFGVWLDGAHWDGQADTLASRRPRDVLCLMPVIHFLPQRHYTPDPTCTYRAPWYQTLARGSSAEAARSPGDFIDVVYLPSDNGSERWTLAGVALICQPES